MSERTPTRLFKGERSVYLIESSVEISKAGEPREVKIQNPETGEWSVVTVTSGPLWHIAGKWS